MTYTFTKISQITETILKFNNTSNYRDYSEVSVLNHLKINQV